MSTGGAPTGAELARITVAAPRRRVDVALPAHVPLADLLPSLLRHAGEALADEGEGHGGWVLRKVDGEPLVTGRPLSAQIRDGEVVHLVPARREWPEPDYDDVADAIASTSRRHVPPWDGRATLAYGLVGIGAVLALGLYPVLSYRDGWTVPAAVAFGIAGLLTLVGMILARALADARSGAVLASYALPYAFIAGLLILGGDDPLADLSGAHFLLGSATLLCFSALGYLGVAAGGRLFIGGGLAGLSGIAGALIAERQSAAGAAAVVTALLVAAVVGFPLLAMRLGKLPLPVVPQGPGDLGGAAPPAGPHVSAAVARADELLTGLLIGAAIGQIVAALVLTGGGVSGAILMCVAGVVNLLRARLFVTVRHRLPLLIAGTVTLAVAGIGALSALEPARRLLIGAIAVVVIGATMLAAAVTYGRRRPSPYLGRAAEILDVVLLLGVVPLACAVLGLFGWVRGLGG
jgi:type VII secretion integral membrane protein EccD